MKKKMANEYILALILGVATLTSAHADGFKLSLQENQIVAKNTEGYTPDELFGHNFDLVNNADETYESSHGSVDANDPGSGFKFTVGGQSDTFRYNIRGIWTYSNGEARRATSGATLNLLKASNGVLLSQIDGQMATPTSFGIAANDTHELIWSIPQAASFDVLGLVFTVTGNSAMTGLAYYESAPLVVVHWKSSFAENPEVPMQAILAAARSSAGDFNGDGYVDAADYTVWRDQLGQTLGKLAADGDGDNDVDEDDYMIWKKCFGTTQSGLGSESQAIPEPATAKLLTLYSLMIVSTGSRIVRSKSSSRLHSSEVLPRFSVEPIVMLSSIFRHSRISLSQSQVCTYSDRTALVYRFNLWDTNRRPLATLSMLVLLPPRRALRRHAGSCLAGVGRVAGPLVQAH
jgi:hypothetical protein